jgi:hypothetical protein
MYSYSAYLASKPKASDFGISSNCSAPFAIDESLSPYHDERGENEPRNMDFQPLETPSLATVPLLDEAEHRQHEPFDNASLSYSTATQTTGSTGKEGTAATSHSEYVSCHMCGCVYRSKRQLKVKLLI